MTLAVGGMLNTNTTTAYTFCNIIFMKHMQVVHTQFLGVQWLSGRVLDWRPRGCGFQPHRRHCVVSLSKNINPSLVLVQPRKTCPFITERLLMGRKESNQAKQKAYPVHTPHIAASDQGFHCFLTAFANKISIKI